MTDEKDKSQTAIKLSPPFEFPMSKNVTGVYGFKDAHVELRVKLPFPLSTVKKTFEQGFTLEELEKLKEGVDKALEWAKLGKEDRERLGV